ncbi:MAG: hypothetical protein R2724_18045 [Bryobacterales bacterium]
MAAPEAFAHDSVSHAMYTLEKLGEESGLFDVRFHTDTELVTKQKLGANKKNLDWFDAVMFYTQGDLPLSEQQKADLMAFVRKTAKAYWRHTQARIHSAIRGRSTSTWSAEHVQPPPLASGSACARR